jgi:predicted membrane protein
MTHTEQHHKTMNKNNTTDNGVVLYVSSDVWFLFIVYWCCPVCVISCMVFIHRLLVLFCMCRLLYGFYSSFAGVVLYVSSGVWFLFIVYCCCSVCVIWCMVFIHRLLMLFCMWQQQTMNKNHTSDDTSRTTSVNDE